jgi:Resolvase, N terminal domain
VTVDVRTTAPTAMSAINVLDLLIHASQLAEALAASRVHGAKLIIAKLDRLARDVAFVSNLMESGVDFEAVDFPQANRLTIHILAAVAEHEARMISERTKAALASAKARGVNLGGDRGAETAIQAAVWASPGDDPGARSGLVRPGRGLGVARNIEDLRSGSFGAIGVQSGGFRRS